MFAFPPFQRSTTNVDFSMSASFCFASAILLLARSALGSSLAGALSIALTLASSIGFIVASIGAMSATHRPDALDAPPDGGPSDALSPHAARDAASTAPATKRVNVRMRALLAGARPRMPEASCAGMPPQSVRRAPSSAVNQTLRARPVSLDRAFAGGARRAQRLDRRAESIR